jgi:hypothetical protein
MNERRSRDQSVIATVIRSTTSVAPEAGHMAAVDLQGLGLNDVEVW